jgi:diadenosine tetraphosphatase ApaH/serine/threonine PP2A family protein phosphatase
MWTRGRLADDERAFLDNLPYTVERDRCLYVHASADRPQAWEYIAGRLAAARCLAATSADIVFAGHVHQPLLYFSARGAVSDFLPQPGIPVPLSLGRRWLALVGSVGQPRDGNPAASYAMLDETNALLTYYRVAYDWMSAAVKIRAAGLPGFLADRLEHGE